MKPIDLDIDMIEVMGEIRKCDCYYLTMILKEPLQESVKNYAVNVNGIDFYGAKTMFNFELPAIVVFAENVR